MMIDRYLDTKKNSPRILSDFIIYLFFYVPLTVHGQRWATVEGAASMIQG